MFGYININSQELSEENKQIYQSYYCGLCRRLRRRFGAKGQMLLNYDMTFLVVLLTGLYEPDEEEGLFVCKVHPGKKREYRVNETTDYAASMNLLLAYHNLVDDWKDERSYTKKTIASMIRRDYQEVAQAFPRQARTLERYMSQIAQVEARNEENIDVAAGLSGEMLGEIFAWKQDEWYDELKTFGYYMGKFIYLMDAYEDFDKDEKHRRYNPFLLLKKQHGDDFEELARLMMTSMIAECAKSFERMPVITHAEILRNILYSGVWSRYEYVQLKKKKRSKR